MAHVDQPSQRLIAGFERDDLELPNNSEVATLVVDPGQRILGALPRLSAVADALTREPMYQDHD